MYGLLRFTFDYCYIKWPSAGLKWTVYALMLLDAAQLLCNPIFHHAFGIEAIELDGFSYYRLMPYLGQSFHRLVDYGILAAIIVLFIVKIVRTPRVYSERYWVILLTILITSAWEMYYIFSRTPVDRSMIGFGAFRADGVLLRAVLPAPAPAGPAAGRHRLAAAGGAVLLRRERPLHLGQSARHRAGEARRAQL